MTMIATVISTDAGSLLVRDTRTGKTVRVFSRNARRFSRGDRIRITYSGAMTRSIPPQITATSIQRIRTPGRFRREIRAVVIQRRDNSLVVRDANNNQIIVHYPFAHHFRTGERITIRHDTDSMINPFEVDATDIEPSS